MNFIGFDINHHGFSNKIFKWETIYHISKINDLKIMYNFPELQHLILPNTENGDVLKLDNLQNFSTGEIKKNNFKLDNTKNWIANDGWNFHWMEWNRENRPLQLMSLRDKNIQNIINNTIKNNIVGLHVRKGFFLETDKIRHDRENGEAFRTPIWWFFSICNQILRIRPDTIFYLASDGPEKELKIYHDNFNIINYKNLCDTNDENLIKMLDIFFLSQCKTVICSTSSTFSHLVDWFGIDKYCIYPVEKGQKIDIEKLKQYMNE